MLSMEDFKPIELEDRELSMDDFKLITLDDMDFFRDFYSKYPPRHSDYVFSTMVCWSHYMRYLYAMYEDCIIIMTELEGKYRLRPPIGPRNLGALKEVFRLCKAQGTDTPLSVVDPRMKEWLENEFPQIVFLPHRDYFDYVYLANDLADLGGKRYLKIRNQLNHFTKNNSYAVEEISDGNFSEVREFLIRWCIRKGCGEEPLLNSERIAVQTALEHIFELGLSGLAIRVNGVIEAFSMFEGMSGDTAIVHFEKANPDLKGIYQAINRETARYLARRYKFINREPDMGIEGLRRAKEKYHPHHMVEVYHVEKGNL